MAKGGNDINIKLGLDMASFVKNIDAATTKMQGSVSKMERSLKGLDGALKAVSYIGSAGAIGALATSVLKASDAYRTLEGRIVQATKATGDSIAVTEQLIQISQRTGTELESNVSLFQSLARGAQELGKTNADVLKLSETIDQLGAIGGSSTEAMKNGITQFSQAMAGGVVRAEEFNSILENMPEVASRIAKGLGVSVGQLRQMVVNGKLLSKDVFEALLKQTDQIQKDFDSMPGSMARAGNTLTTAWNTFIGRLDTAFGITQNIAAVMNTIAGLFAKITLSQQQVKTIQLRNIQGEINQIKSRNADPGMIGAFGGVDFSFGNKKQDMARIAALEKQKAALMKPEKPLATAPPTAPFKPISFGGGGGRARSSSSGGGGRSRASNPLDDEAKSLIERNLTIWEKEAKAIANADTLLKAHKITLEQYNREMATIKQETGDHFSSIAKDISEAREKFFDSTFEKDMTDSIKSTEEFNSKLSTTKNLYEQIQTPQQAYLEKVTQLQSLYSEGFIKSQEDLNLMLGQAKTEYESLVQQTGKANDISQLFAGTLNNIGQSMTNTFVTAVTGGKASFKDFVNSVVQDLARLAFQIAVILPLQRALTGAFTKKSNPLSSVGGFLGFGGMLGQVAGSLAPSLIQRRESGGPVSAGRPYIVGEKRPELFVPNSSGRIIPKIPSGGGASMTVVNNISVQGGSSGDPGKDQEFAKAVSKQIEISVSQQFSKLVQQQQKPGGQLYGGAY